MASIISPVHPILIVLCSNRKSSSRIWVPINSLDKQRIYCLIFLYHHPPISTYSGSRSHTAYHAFPAAHPEHNANRGGYHPANGHFADHVQSRRRCAAILRVLYRVRQIVHSNALVHRLRRGSPHGRCDLGAICVLRRPSRPLAQELRMDRYASTFAST